MKSLTQTMASDNQSVDALTFSDYTDTRVLAASTAEAHAVPAGAKTVIFKATGDFYVNAFGTAAVAIADVIDGTASELNPQRRSLVGVTTLSIIAPAITTVTMSFYA